VEGLLEGFSLGSYLLLIDYTSRLWRQGKARVNREVATILERLGTRAEVWGQRIHGAEKGICAEHPSGRSGKWDLSPFSAQLPYTPTAEDQRFTGGQASLANTSSSIGGPSP